jgi:phage gp37-like protein
LKEWLRARLQELAQSAGDQAVRDEALALARKNSPGIWVAWVPSGTSKNPSASPLD